MTLSDLARDAGISYNAAVRLINGKDRDTFKLSVLKKVASVLGVTPFQLIDPSLDSSVLVGTGNEFLDESIHKFILDQRRSARPGASDADIETALTWLATPQFRFFVPFHKDHSPDPIILTSEWAERCCRGLTASEMRLFNQFAQREHARTRTGVAQQQSSAARIHDSDGSGLGGLGFISLVRQYGVVDESTINVLGSITSIGEKEYPARGFCSTICMTKPWHTINKKNPLRIRRMTYCVIPR